MLFCALVSSFRKKQFPINYLTSDRLSYRRIHQRAHRISQCHTARNYKYWGNTAGYAQVSTIDQGQTSPLLNKDTS
jgi:hypothetical protein